jgi:AcrR family transcriptional regulator
MSSKRMTYHHGDLRRQLIQTAETLIAKQGVEAISMRTLSREIGVSHTAAYRHFQDKQELLRALAQNGFAALAQRLERVAAQWRDNPLAHILAQGKAYIDFALENPSRYRIMFGPILIHNRIEPEFNQAVRQAFTPLLSAIAQGQQRKEIRNDNVLELASMCWSLVHGFSQSIIDGQLLPVLMDASGGLTKKEIARLTGLVLDTVVSGLMPREESITQREALFDAQNQTQL